MSFISKLKALLHKADDELTLTLGIIAHLVPPEQLKAGIELVEQAMVQFGNSQLDLRKQLVVTGLMTLPGMTQSKANLITEMAVQYIKHAAEVAAEKAAAREEAKAGVETADPAPATPPAQPAS